MAGPETHYATTRDGVYIAYSLVGDGPVDLVMLPGWHGNLEVMWEQPLVAEFYERFGAFARVIHHDRRGTGLSDRTVGLPDLETRVDDLGCVLDAIGSEQVALIGLGEGSPLAAMFAGTRPERTRALVLYAAEVCPPQKPDYPWGKTPEEIRHELRVAEKGWGTDRYAEWFLAEDDPSMRHDAGFIAWTAKVERHWVSPGGAAALVNDYSQIDTRHVLPAIAVPALVLWRDGWRPDGEAQARYVASLITGAEAAALPGGDGMPWLGDQASVVEEIRAFLGIAPPPRDVDRILATVMFTDIVGSTQKAAELGDAAWKEVLSAHDERARRAIADARGTYIHTTGDGQLATFDGPARAVRCAQAIADAVRPLDIEIRAGCHTGEIERSGDDIQGLAIHIGARVAAFAGPSEVFVSSTVRDLVAGSGLSFEDAGEHELKGVPETWHLYRVMPS